MGNELCRIQREFLITFKNVCYRGKTIQAKSSKHIFMHISNWYSGKKPIECIGYHPPAPNRPRMKGVCYHIIYIETSWINQKHNIFNTFKNCSIYELW